MSRGVNWSPNDKQVLALVYPTGTKAELLAAFPTRSWCGIKRMAQDLALKRDREAANEARSEAAVNSLRQKKGTALGPRQTVIHRPAPVRDADLVASALQAQPAFLSVWVAGLPRPAASSLSAEPSRLCGGAQGAAAHGGLQA